MPIYEYTCPDCDCKFELLRPISKSDEDAPCPQCQHAASRVLSLFACFSRNADGESSPIISPAGSCAGCTSTNCSSCHS